MADAVNKGYRKLLERTVDTDVVVVAIATLNRTKPDELCVAFGTGGHFRFIPIHDVAAAVGPRKSATLPPVPCTNRVRHRVFVCRYRKEDRMGSLFLRTANIYIIIRHCPGVGAFPRPFCVPNSVALASLTLQVGDWAIH